MVLFSNADLILIVNYLSSFGVGVVGPVLAPHMMMNGANHIILGCMGGMSYICQNMSRHVMVLFEHGKKYAINFSLFVFFVSCFSMVFYSYWTLAFFNRLIYALTNQVLDYSKQFISRTEAESAYIKYCNLIDIIRVAGLSTGSAMSGYIFMCNEDFSANAMVSSVAILAGILVLQQVDYDDTEIHRPQSEIMSLPSKLCSQLQNLREISYKNNWDAILLKTAYISSFTVFFSRYSFIITFNYKVGSVVVGYSVAYQHMWLFAVNCLVPFIRAQFHNKTKVFEHAILICGFVFAALFYAPTYECYLMLLVPLFFTYALVNSLLEDDALNLRTHEKVNEATVTLGNLVNVVAPIAFGIVCQVFGGYAFKVLTLMPSVVCVYIVNQHILNKRRNENEEEEEEEEVYHTGRTKQE